MSLLCGACAAAGCALPSSHIPKNFVALQCARRCGLRIAFVASERLRIWVRCGACAAVGRALRASQPGAEEFRCSCVDMVAFAKDTMVSRNATPDS